VLGGQSTGTRKQNTQSYAYRLTWVSTRCAVVQELGPELGERARIQPGEELGPVLGPRTGVGRLEPEFHSGEAWVTLGETLGPALGAALGAALGPALGLTLGSALGEAAVIPRMSTRTTTREKKTWDDTRGIFGPALSSTRRTGGEV
jgi:hypothetical protein